MNENELNNEKDVNININNKKIVLKPEFKLIEVIIIIIITMVIGIIIGYAVTNRFSLGETEKKIKDDVYLKEFVDTYQNVTDKYYESLDKKELISNAIKGMLSGLDNYSVYMDEDITDEFNERLYGDYTGIGTEITMTENGDVVIYNPFEGSPAEKAGLKKGDIITKIDGEDVKGKTSSDISKMIKGMSGSKVNITITRDGKEMDFNVTRETIVLDSVTYKLYEKNDKKIGYINISIFAANTYSQFRKAILDLENQKIDSLIIDVRNNTGGYLDSVTQILNMFLKKNDIIYQLDDQGDISLIKDDSNEFRSYKVGVIINEYSASASEILAAAIKESYNGEVIGVNSYGKGTVQQTKELSIGGMMKFTTQKWLTPKGNWINEKGVEPTTEVKINENYYQTLLEEDDNQLQKAIELFSK
ncbi:MAG: S41 family peptidase [Firmicutes bacterium]|nr:S41 family peptidase [Bacillota bacterium]